MEAITTKICTKCKQVKAIDNFSKLKSQSDGLNYKCNDCKRDDSKKYYQVNKERINIRNNLYYQNNLDKFRIKHGEYYRNNIEKMKLQGVVYRKQRMKTDPCYRFIRLLRSRINDGIKNNRIPTNKSQHTRDLLCCDWQYARDHLEKQFIDGMTWENQGSVWHTDHIIPLSFFNLDDLTECKIANHWGNLQPLFTKDNLQKGNKIPQKTNFNY